MNLRPSGYEPDGLPDCPTPHSACIKDPRGIALPVFVGNVHSKKTNRWRKISGCDGALENCRHPLKPGWFYHDPAV